MGTRLSRWLMQHDDSPAPQSAITATAAQTAVHPGWQARKASRRPAADGWRFGSAYP